MFYNKFSKYKKPLVNIVFGLVFVSVFWLDMLYSNVYALRTSIKVPYLFFGLLVVFVVLRLFYKYVLSSLRTNNFNYDL